MTTRERLEKAKVEARQREALMDILETTISNVEVKASWYWSESMETKLEDIDDYDRDRYEACQQVIEHLAKLL